MRGLLWAVASSTHSVQKKKKRERLYRGDLQPAESWEASEEQEGATAETQIEELGVLPTLFLIFLPLWSLCSFAPKALPPLGWGSGIVSQTGISH